MLILNNDRYYNESMRTKAADKEQIKKEILKDSVKTFKKFGQAGAPVDQVMKRAGLTSGALYSHFKGKDDLFFQATMFELDGLIAHYGELIGRLGNAGLKELVDDYLTLRHVHNPELGCLFAALSVDIARMKAQGKSDFEMRYQALMDIFASAIGKGTKMSKEEKKKTARVIHAIMVGSVTVGRGLKNDEVIEEILASAKSQIYKLID